MSEETVVISKHSGLPTIVHIGKQPGAARAKPKPRAVTVDPGQSLADQQSQRRKTVVEDPGCEAALTELGQRMAEMVPHGQLGAETAKKK